MPADWIDDLPGGLQGEPLDALSDWSDLGLGPPDTWTNFDVDMDVRGESVHIGITDSEGFEYGFDYEGPVSDVDSWDWAWDMWDWIADYFDWVDEDSEYAE